MDKIPCQTCGFDSDDREEIMSKVQEERNALKKQLEKANQDIVSWKIQDAQGMSSGDRLGRSLVKTLCTAILLLVAILHVPKIVQAIKPPNDIVVMSQELKDNFRICNDHASNDRERFTCLNSFTNSFEDIVRIVEKKHSVKMDNLEAP